LIVFPIFVYIISKIISNHSVIVYVLLVLPTIAHVKLLIYGFSWVLSHQQYIKPLIKGIIWVSNKMLLVVLTAFGTFLGMLMYDRWKERDSGSDE